MEILHPLPLIVAKRTVKLTCTITHSCISNFYFLFLVYGKESIVFGSNFQNKNFDGFTNFEIFRIRKSHFNGRPVCVCLSVYLLSAYIKNK